ncbi:MAG TPA: GNAT family N-acetyltransferase [Burkholderiales bacterium]|nr:GNAT family N-acetyltransferase [Burkholderiales bacterium]
MISIRPARMRDAEGYHACLDAVARERVHLGMIAAPSMKDSRAYLRWLLDAKCAILVVVEDGRIVGWCDVAPREMEGFRHTGGLGMGLIPEMRGRGLGARLLRKAIAQCRRGAIEKIELQVYASNRSARALYRRFGFRQEGRRVRARKLDGKYDDVILMGKLL